MSTTICLSCSGISFYEAGDGMMFCNTCGTQSQEWFAESFNIDIKEGNTAPVRGRLSRLSQQVIYYLTKARISAI